jgi:tetratricopeptide (TPR) repeat protein
MTGTKVVKAKIPLDKYRRWVWTSQSIFLAVWLAMSVWLLVDAALHPTIYYVTVNLVIFFLWNVFVLPTAVASMLSLYLVKGQEKGNYLAVERTYSRYQRNFPWLFAANRKVAATNYCNLGTARLYQGNYEGAEQSYAQAVAVAASDKKFAKTAYMGMLYNNLAVCLMHQGRLEEAEHIAQNAVDLVRDKTARKWGAAQGLPLTTMGGILVLQNRLDEAGERLDEAQSYYAQDPGRGNMKVSQFVYRALLAARQGKLDQSISYFKELMQLREACPAWFSNLSVMPLYLLANEYMNAKQFDAAQQALQVAYAVAKEHPVHPVSVKLRSFCEKLLLLTDRKSEIADMHSWLWDPKDSNTLTQEGGKQ